MTPRASVDRRSDRRQELARGLDPAFPDDSLAGSTCHPIWHISGTNEGARLLRKASSQVRVQLSWRWRWDLNPRWACTHTRFRGVLLRPLGHATADEGTRAAAEAEIRRRVCWEHPRRQGFRSPRPVHRRFSAVPSSDRGPSVRPADRGALRRRAPRPPDRTRRRASPPCPGRRTARRTRRRPRQPRHPRRNA